jgi:predicted dehydrogenase
MKILIAGLGSAGQRHLRNIRGEYGDSVEILAFRKRGSQRTLTDSLEVREGVLLEREYGVRPCYDLGEALSHKPDIAFVTNITSMHVPVAIEAVKAGCDVFVEKPLSCDMRGVRSLHDLASESGRIVFLGFQNRYHAALRKVKAAVDGGALGKIVSVFAEVGEQISTMHAYEDYRETYLARAEMGGGLILNQFVHELDYLRWLFGEPRSVFAVAGNMEMFDIDVEDQCSALMIMESHNQSIPVAALADFYQRPPSRRLKVVGSKGWMEADLTGNSLTSALDGALSTEVFADFGRNDMFVAELRDFMGCVESRGAPQIGLMDGIASLQAALAVRKSVEEAREVRVDEIKW